MCRIVTRMGRVRGGKVVIYANRNKGKWEESLEREGEEEVGEEEEEEV